MPIPRSLLKHVYRILGRGYHLFSNPFNEDSPLHIFPHLQITSSRVEEIHDLLIVDLEVRTFDQVLRLLLGGFSNGIGEQKVENSGLESSHQVILVVPVQASPLHGKSLSSSCLAVGEDGAVVPLQTGLDEREADTVEDVLLGGGLATHPIKAETLGTDPYGVAAAVVHLYTYC